VKFQRKISYNCSELLLGYFAKAILEGLENEKMSQQVATFKSLCWVELSRFSRAIETRACGSRLNHCYEPYKPML